MRRLLGTLALSLLSVLAIGSPALAAAPTVVTDTSDFTFDSFDADYTLSRLPDGAASVAVVETIVARFPDFDQNRGIIRAIPNDNDGVPLETAVVSVVDENGVAVPFEQTLTGGFVELALGTDDFVYGQTTYVISYTQRNVVRAFADTASDEFYWDINGTGWAQPFGSVSATVHIDPALVPELSGNAACYVGAQGETNACEITATGGPVDPADSSPDVPAEPAAPVTYSAQSTDLAPGETLTVSIGFAASTFVIPEAVLPPQPEPIPLGVDLASGGIGLLSLGALAAAIVVRVRSGRGAPGRGTIIPQYSEPEGITIVQSAHLMSRASSALPAAIVRLAVRKNLRILAYELEKDGEPWSLQFLTDARADAEDLALLRALFGEDREPGAILPFGQSSATEMAALTALSAGAKASLPTSGLQTRAGGRGKAIGLVLVQVGLGILAIIAVVVTAIVFNNLSAWILPSMFVGVIAFIVSIGLAIRPLVVTDAGAEARDFLLGMRLYLTIAEQDRLRALQSPTGALRVNVGDNAEMVKLYEKLLPWAVLWGVEDQWMRELAVRVEQLPEQPDWFLSSTGFNAALFGTTVRGFGPAISPPATSSSWSGSSGGSFSGGSFGGGFSGGGGGGGGGGGR